jgi:hypothetical protein
MKQSIIHYYKRNKMKKGAILILLVSGIFLTCCSKKSDNTNNVLAKPNDTIAFVTLNAQEALFDNVHYALGSTVYGGSAIATNGQSVGKIYDLKGNVNIPYAGDAAPTLTGIPPTLIDDKWLTFDNRPNTEYNSAPFTAIKPPFEVWLVSRNMPGQRYEAKLQGGDNACYLGDNSSGIRIINSAYGFVPNSTVAPNYQTTLERVVIKTDNTSDYYQNGVWVGNVAFQGNDINGVVKKILAVGPYTNSMDFDFAAMYFKAGAFTTADAATIYNSIATKWKVGTIPTNRILLSHIKWDNVNGVYTPSATVINTPTGTTVADPSTWDYQWFWFDAETNLNIQTLFSTKRVVTQADFPLNDATHHNVSIKFRVRPKDTNGKSWRYFSGTFGSYTNQSQE